MGIVNWRQEARDRARWRRTTREALILLSGAIQEYDIHMKGLCKIVKNKTKSTFARLHSNTEPSNTANIFFVNHRSIPLFQERYVIVLTIKPELW